MFRGIGAALAVALAVLPAAAMAMGLPYQTNPPNLITTVVAMGDFLNTLGINLHAPGFGNYANSSLYLSKLYSAGWRHVRTNYNIGDANGTNGTIIRDLAAHGVKVSITSEGVMVNDGCYNNGAGGNYTKCANDFVNDLVNNNLASSINEILGPNEINGNYTNWQTIIPKYMAALHTAFKGNPATQNILIVAPNFNAPDQTALFQQLGNISASLDMGDIHSNGGDYLCRNEGAGNIIGTDCWFKLINNNEANVAGTNLPYENTEHGWSDGTCSAPGNPAPSWANGLMLTRHYFEMFRWNISYSNVYEMMDEGTNGCYENSFGMVDFNGNPKTEYNIFSAFTTLLADTGTPLLVPFTYTLTGTTSNTRSLIFQKSDGSYWLAVWEQLEVWVPDTTPKHLVSPPPPEASVTLTLPCTYNMTVYTPVDETGTINGTTALATATNKSSITFNSQAGVTLIKIH